MFKNRLIEDKKKKKIHSNKKQLETTEYTKSGLLNIDF